MKKLTFKVSSPKNSSLVSLLKDLNKISCRILIDFENEFVTAKNINDSMIEDIIDLINNYYNISRIYIDNTFEQETEESSISDKTKDVEKAIKSETHDDTQLSVSDFQSQNPKIKSEEIVKSETSSKKVNNEETALLEIIGFAFDKLDSSKNVIEQVKPFLIDIGMVTTENLVTQAFIIACDTKKINYENIILRLHKKFPQIDEKTIKNTIRKTFKNWLDKYPTLAEKCPKISLMAILKIFAKKFQ